MPNHVSNTLEINVWNRDRENRIEEIKEYLAGDDEGRPTVIDFNNLIPEPEDNNENWYSWRCDNWGTKWNAYEAYIEDESHDHIIYKFDTAWAPPLPVIEKLREVLEEKYGEEGDVYVSGMWVEEGYQSAGVY